MRTFTLILVIFVLIFTGCGGSEREATPSNKSAGLTDEAPSGASLPPPPTYSGSGSGEVLTYADKHSEPTTPPTPTPQQPVPTKPIVQQRQIIRSGSVSLIVEKLDSAEARLAAISATHGGFIANSSRQMNPGNALSGNTQIRVPAAAFDTVLMLVRGIGAVQSENVSSSDVTEEYIDLQARLKTQQELEARILKLLAERSGKLMDIVEIEQKLAEVRSTIEGIQGRLRFLQDQVGLSTLTVTMTEPGAVGTSETETFWGQISKACNEGLDGLVGMISWMIRLIIALLPLFVVVLAVVWVVRWWMQRKKKNPATSAISRDRKEASSTEKNG